MCKQLWVSTSLFIGIYLKIDFGDSFLLEHLEEIISTTPICAPFLDPDEMELRALSFPYPRAAFP